MFIRNIWGVQGAWRLAPFQLLDVHLASWGPRMLLQHSAETMKGLGALVPRKRTCKEKLNQQ